MHGKKIAILGSTGSIGQNALQVAKAHGHTVCALAAATSIDALAAQAADFPHAWLNVASRQHAESLRRKINPQQRVTWGEQGLKQLIEESRAELVLNAISGAAGLSSTMTILQAGIDLALANKESLVMGGQLVTGLARQKGARILPVDSEHSAIWQLWPQDKAQQVRQIWLTASGGPFRAFSQEQLASITPAMALKHPRWQMGPKITIDSATLMNKGLEVIEAAHLFDFPLKKIKVVIHPQSLVHGLLEMNDGSLLAQMGPTDMRLPIALALDYPERLAPAWPILDVLSLGRLEFFEPNYRLFPALKLAIAAGQSGGSAPTVLNAANEVAINAFLQHNLPFTGIVACVEEVLHQLPVVAINDLGTILAMDAKARKHAEAWIKENM